MDQYQSLVKIAQLTNDGWTKMPFDEPESAMTGFLLFKDDGEKELQQIISWPIYGKEFEPDVQNVNIQSFLEFIKAHNGSEYLFRYDDPKALKYGAVYYDILNAKAIVRRVRVIEITRLSYEEKEAIIKLRDGLRTKTNY